MRKQKSMQIFRGLVSLPFQKCYFQKQKKVQENFV